MSTEILGEAPVVDYPVDGQQPELTYLSITTVIERPSKVNQHEVELSDINLGERIGFLKGGEERQGMVISITDHPFEDLNDLLFKVDDDEGYLNCTRGANITWREIL